MREPRPLNAIVQFKEDCAADGITIESVDEPAVCSYVLVVNGMCCSSYPNVHIADWWESFDKAGWGAVAATGPTPTSHPPLARKKRGLPQITDSNEFH